MPANSRYMLLLNGMLLLSLSLFASTVLAGQTIVGWQEEASLYPGNFKIRAKLDTGADNSSINAVNPESYNKDGREWVRFKLQNRHGQPYEIDTPVIKTTKIKTKSGGWQLRKVIELEICIAGLKKNAVVNLVDRSHFKFQLLIGRSYLKPDLLVDSAQTYLSQAACQ